MRPDYLLAWLLPLLAGGGLWWLANGRHTFRGQGVAMLGAGWIAGVLGAAALAGVFGRDDTPHALAAATPALLAGAALAWLLAALRWYRGHPPAFVPASRPPPLLRGLWWLLLVLVVVRFALLGDEAALRPVFPWDAWSAWAFKPKSWLLLGQAESYVPMADWLAQPKLATRTLATWNYPELLAWLQVWFASGAGGWNEPLVNLAWCGALAAFALAAYGYWRGAGLSPLVALGLVYALVSLPLVDAHVALAGYADLWVAVTLGLATLAWSRWLVTREIGQWLLGVGFALCLPALKLEGAIWLLAFAAVVVLDLIPPRWRARTGAGVLAVLAIVLVLGGFSLPLPGLGWVEIAWGRIAIPAVAPFELTWHAVGGAMLESLFTLPNWHLLWYALPLLAVLRWRVLRDDHAARMLGLLVLLQLACLFVLFFFTSAAAWAEDFTSVNRLILQIVPSVFVLVAALVRESRDSGLEMGDSGRPRQRRLEERRA
jgi:hypothetical protein